jgi:hypothetical protein
MQLAAGLRERDAEIEVVHPVELLDRAYGGGHIEGTTRA